MPTPYEKYLPFTFACAARCGKNRHSNDPRCPKCGLYADDDLQAKAFLAQGIIKRKHVEDKS